jgi:succinate dehydrogenase / fumarate reductase, cytochrome b subunit
MTSRFKAVSSSVGTKILIALTGLVLIVYLILHLVGNALVFLGPETFNGYSHRLISNPLIIPIEIGLLAIFALHIYKAVRMAVTNQQARPVKYVRKERADHTSRKSLASSTMIVTGLITLVFVIIHLQHFKFGTEYLVSGTDTRDLYRLEMELFSNPLIVGLYVACMVVVGFHLWHGFSSAFQSLGADDARFTPRIRALGKLLALVITGGFIIIPIWVLLAGGRS